MAENKKFLDKDGLTYFYDKIKGEYVKNSDLATVATSGSYNDLSDKPTIPTNTINNLVDGTAEGSIRSINAKDNTDSYPLGKNAQAFGDGTIASGEGAHAEGRGTMATGGRAHAEGWNSEARGDESHAEGNSYADGHYSHSEGSSYAKGDKSHAEGGTTAEGFSSHSEGWSSHSGGDYSHSEGWGSYTWGTGAHAEGEESVATARASHAEGYNTLAGSKGYEIISKDSSSMTYYLNSVDDLSVGLECFITSETEAITDLGQITAINTTDKFITTSSFSSQGDYICIKDRPDLGDCSALFRNWYPSHAEGDSSIATGLGAHAEGRESWAIKEGTHAEGYGTLAASNYQHVQGKFNLKDTAGDYVHIVGNGTSDSDRSNIHTLTWSGNAWYKGEVFVGDDEKRLANVDEIPTKVSELTNDSNFITAEYHDSTKQDVISDLSTIRSGAAAGATALQSGDNISELTNDSGYLTEHQYIGGKENISNKSSSYTESSSTTYPNTKALVDGLATKQATLATQTAYSESGSATKVPQITTNDLGQVTKITEVTITQPTKVSELTNDSGYTTNTGTVTKVAVKMNGEVQGTISKSGTIDLGTVCQLSYTVVSTW